MTLLYGDNNPPDDKVRTRNCFASWRVCLGITESMLITAIGVRMYVVLVMTAFEQIVFLAQNKRYHINADADHGSQLVGRERSFNSRRATPRMEENEV